MQPASTEGDRAMAETTQQRSDAGQAGRHPGQPQSEREPKPPFPKQHQSNPGVGLESKLNPRPNYQAPQYKAAGKLQGKSALITGGESGIGRGVAGPYPPEGPAAR